MVFLEESTLRIVIQNWKNYFNMKIKCIKFGNKPMIETGEKYQEINLDEI